LDLSCLAAATTGKPDRLRASWKLIDDSDLSQPTRDHDMAKKRTKTDPKGPGQKKRPQSKDVAPDGDRLGKLVKQYGVNLAEMIVACGMLGLIGGGILLYAFNQDPAPILWLIIGGGVLFMGVALLVYNALNVGRRLEVRKLGVRFTELGESTEFTWDEIVEIEIDRRDETYLGVASVEKRSSNASSPSGPLTKTEWDVTILAQDGRSIHLKPMFLRIVPDPKKLISQLRLGAGIR
jgi:hypothetical protein